MACHLDTGWPPPAGMAWLLSMAAVATFVMALGLELVSRDI